MKKTFHLVSLGCAKNLVDSECIFGSLTEAGLVFEKTPEKADVLILNTCGFIEPAVEEAIEEILSLAAIKRDFPPKKLIVVGCLVERYRQSLISELPEVDFFLGTDAASHIQTYLDGSIQPNTPEEKLAIFPRSVLNSSMPRILATPSFMAYCKIMEGCSNNCSYCLIPSIRGRARSRTKDDILLELQGLTLRGVQEISLIAQDLTAFGKDSSDGENLVMLLDQITQQTEIPWIRLLYLYPSGITDDLLELMASNSRLLPYLDIPFQHASTRILQSMNRRYSGDDLYALVEKIRDYLPDIALRTTFLVGFPGETEKDIEQIETMLKNLRLDHVGVFPFAQEEGCAAEHLDNQIPEEERLARQERILELQAILSADIQKKYIGRVEEVLVEGYAKETDLLLEGRSRFQAPEIDGCVYITDGTANPGDIVKVRISETQIYDLIGTIDE